MVTTITLNPAIDATWILDVFAENIINRVVDMQEDAGGKGINISRFLTMVGTPTLATGFVGGNTGEKLCSLLNDAKVEHDFVQLDGGETRTNLTVFVKKDSKTLKINQSGPDITDTDMLALHKKIVSVAGKSKFIALSGKNPPGASNNLTIQMLKAAKEKGAKIALDSESFSVDEILDIKPYFFKPNDLEFEVLLGKKDLHTDDYIKAARELCNKGVQYIAISMGEKGILGVSVDKAYKITVPEIDVRSTVGAGDSVVTGFLKASVDNTHFAQALQTGAAYGTAMATTDGTELPSVKIIEQIFADIKVEQLV